MATWTSRGMDKFLCEDFGLSSISEYYGGFVSVGKNIYKVAYSNDDKFIKVWKYNIKENLPWKEVSSFFCPLPGYLRVDIKEVVVRQNEIFVFMRQHFGCIVYSFVPVFDIQSETWTLPPYKGFQIPDLEEDRLIVSTCLVGDNFLVYSSESFDNIEDFHSPEHGGTDR